MRATAANTPNPSLAPATGLRCLDVLLDPSGAPPYFRQCQCRKLRRSDLVDGAALLFAVVAIAAWGCL